MRMSLTPPPDTQLYASLIAAMQETDRSVSSELFARLDSTDEPHPLPEWQCLKSLDDLDEEADEEDADDDDLDEDDDEDDEDIDEDFEEDDDDDDDEEEDEDEEEEDDDDGVKPLKM